MQRWILLGLVGAVILLSAGAFGVWSMRQNRALEQWVPMPLNATSSKEECAQTLQEIQRLLMHESVLQKVVKEMNLQERFGLKSNEEAVARLKSSMFVREGEFRHPMTQETFPSIDIGVSGKTKERVLLGEIAMRLSKETRTLLGITEDP
jgi:hypothetical protein